VERVSVIVKRLAEEHNTMSPARAQTQTARYGLTIRPPRLHSSTDAKHRKRFELQSVAQRINIFQQLVEHHILNYEMDLFIKFKFFAMWNYFKTLQ